MQAHSLEVFILAKIVFYPKKFTILYCCLLIIASIITMFSFQGAFFEFLFQETQWNKLFTCFSQSLEWWRVPGSNRWPPACKAGALPAELTPHVVETKSTPYAFYASIKCLTVALFLLSKSNPLRWALIWWLGLCGGPKWTRTIDLTIISRVL